MPSVEFTEIDRVQTSFAVVRSLGLGKIQMEHTHASVIALTQRNKASVKATSLAGVEEPQKMTAAKRHVTMK